MENNKKTEEEREHEPRQSLKFVTDKKEELESDGRLKFNTNQLQYSIISCLVLFRFVHNTADVGFKTVT